MSRSRRLDLGIGFTFVMASPRLRPREVLRVLDRAARHEWRSLVLPIVNAFLPACVLRAGFRRSGACDLVYLSAAARDRYAALGLPRGRLLAPRVQAGWAQALSQRPHSRDGRQFTLGYFGPALAARGACLALRAFERAVERGLDGRLLLLLRPDAPTASTRVLLDRTRRSLHAARIEVVVENLREADLVARLGTCDAFLLPFVLPISEVPLVVIEAGMTGKRVIVVDAPGVSEFARAFGATVAAGARGLPQAILKAAQRDLSRLDRATDWSDRAGACAPLIEALPEPTARYRMIAIAGADGSGKTLLADRLAQRLARRGIANRRVWSRFRNYTSKPLLALARITGHNVKERVDGTLIGYHRFERPPLLVWSFAGLQVIDQMIDILTRFRRRRSLLIADRCVLDTLVDVAVDIGRPHFATSRAARLLLRLLPKPTLLVVVSRRPAAIAVQRPDALRDRNFLTRQRLFAELARAFDIPIVENDGSIHEALVAIEHHVERNRELVL